MNMQFEHFHVRLDIGYPITHDQEITFLSILEFLGQFDQQTARMLALHPVLQ